MHTLRRNLSCSLQEVCSVSSRSEICWLLQLEVADLEPYLANVNDKALKHSLQYGVGFLHETMSPAEQEIVNRLFNNGAIQVCVQRRSSPDRQSAAKLNGHESALSIMLLLSLFWVCSVMEYPPIILITASHSLPRSCNGIIKGCGAMVAGAGGHGAHLLGHDSSGLPGDHHGHAVLRRQRRDRWPGLPCDRPAPDDGPRLAPRQGRERPVRIPH